MQNHYRESLKEISGIRLLPAGAEGEGNDSYFPILIEAEYPLTRDELYSTLREHEIYARRYFLSVSERLSYVSWSTQCGY